MDIMRLLSGLDEEKILSMAVSLIIEVSSDKDKLARLYVILRELARDERVKRALTIIARLIERAVNDA